MSFARFAQTVSPLAWKPPARPRPKDDHGVFFGKEYKLNGVSYTFIPNRFLVPGEYDVVIGVATSIGGNNVIREVSWDVNRMELVDDVR